MKKILFATFVSVCFLGRLSISPVHAQQPKTVTDFYFALPSMTLPASSIHVERDSYPWIENTDDRGKAAIEKYRRSLIKVEDIKNGYLRLEIEMRGGWVEIAIFKKTDGSYIVALSDIGCDTGCDNNLELLSLTNGKWSDVTKRYFPLLSREEKDVKGKQGCIYKLPQIGRTVKMVCGGGGVYDDPSNKVEKFQFEWNGEKFVRID